jgi:hypothetical protein
VCFLSLSLGEGIENTHIELDKNHITSQNMGDSFYHIFTTPYLFLLPLFFEGLGVGIHTVISKNYHMSDITLMAVWLVISLFKKKKKINTRIC